MQTALLILPNFVLILVGLALARGFDYGRGFWEGLEKLVYFVLFPALLLRSIAVSALDFASLGKVIACAWGVMILGMALGWLARPLFRVEPVVGLPASSAPSASTPTSPSPWRAASTAPPAWPSRRSCSGR